MAESHSQCIGLCPISPDKHYADGIEYNTDYTDYHRLTQMGLNITQITRMMRMKSPERATQWSVGFYPMNTMRSMMAESHSQCIGLCPISPDKHYADGIEEYTDYTDYHRLHWLNMRQMGNTGDEIWHKYAAYGQ